MESPRDERGFCTRPWWQFWKDPHTWGPVEMVGPGQTIPGAGGQERRRCLHCDCIDVLGYFNS